MGVEEWGGDGSGGVGGMGLEGWGGGGGVRRRGRITKQNLLIA
jgi:hypothetical protein